MVDTITGNGRSDGRRDGAVRMAAPPEPADRRDGTDGTVPARPERMPGQRGTVPERRRLAVDRSHGCREP